MGSSHRLVRWGNDSPESVSYKLYKREIPDLFLMLMVYIRRQRQRLSPEEEARIALLAPFRRGVSVRVKANAQKAYPGETAEVVRVGAAANANILVRCRFGRDLCGRSVLRWVPIEELVPCEPVEEFPLQKTSA